MAKVTFKDIQSFRHTNIAVETWHQIFQEASHIESADEFSTSATAYIGLPWEENTSYGEAIIRTKDLFKALRTRRNIALVSKTWYSMGIEVLYSHLRLGRFLVEEPNVCQLLTDRRHLLAYTKRLTVTPYWHDASSDSSPLDYYHRAARVCANLPRLRILDAPANFFSISRYTQ